MKTGFTLIELLIVIAIILILIAIALPNFIEARMRGQVVHAMAEMRTLTEAEDMHFLDHKTFTQDIIDPGDEVGNSLTTPIPYIAVHPLDPFQKYRNQSHTLQVYRIGTGNEKISALNGYGGPIQCRPTPYNDCTQNTERFPVIADSMMVLTKGPDDRDSGGQIQLYPHPKHMNQSTYRVYSPTNGTYSEGDIYRLTGSIPQFYRFLIGQR